MRNSILIVVAISLVPFQAQAQAGLDVAVKGGPNTATLDRETRDHRYGVSGGLASYLHWRFSSRFTLGGQIETLYTSRGSKIVAEGETAGLVRQHYLDFMLAIRPEARIGPVSIYLLLGGGWNLLLSASNKNAGTGDTRDITEFVSRHDLALLGGAGVAFHLPGQQMGPFQLGTVFLEARHDRGLIDIDDTIMGSTKNRSTALMAGLSFALGSSQAAK